MVGRVGVPCGVVFPGCREASINLGSNGRPWTGWRRPWLVADSPGGWRGVLGVAVKCVCLRVVELSSRHKSPLFHDREIARIVFPDFFGAGRRGSGSVLGRDQEVARTVTAGGSVPRVLTEARSEGPAPDPESAHRTEAALRPGSATRSAGRSPKAPIVPTRRLPRRIWVMRMMWAAARAALSAGPRFASILRSRRGIREGDWSSAHPDTRAAIAWSPRVDWPRWEKREEEGT